MRGVKQAATYNFVIVGAGSAGRRRSRGCPYQPRLDALVEEFRSQADGLISRCASWASDLIDPAPRFDHGEIPDAGKLAGATSVDVTTTSSQTGGFSSESRRCLRGASSFNL